MTSTGQTWVRWERSRRKWNDEESALCTSSGEERSWGTLAKFSKVSSWKDGNQWIGFVVFGGSDNIKTKHPVSGKKMALHERILDYLLKVPQVQTTNTSFAVRRKERCLACSMLPLLSIHTSPLWIPPMWWRSLGCSSVSLHSINTFPLGVHPMRRIWC